MIESMDGDLAALLPPDLHAAWQQSLDSWDERAGSRRLWDRDPTVWTGGDEGRWLGWLDLPESSRALVPELGDFDRGARELSHVLLLGMGGSSLGAEALVRCSEVPAGARRFHLLDSTEPDQIRATLARLDLRTTLVFVASKSGGTLETRLLGELLEERLEADLGDESRLRMVAVTDPGSGLASLAEERHYRRTFFGREDVGGRFSVLSPFGLAPAAMAGVDVDAVLSSAAGMAQRCRAPSSRHNPGAGLGTLLAAAASIGRDKLSLLYPPRLVFLAGWLEQLIAESTGKGGQGLLPVLDGNDMGDFRGVGEDRLFVSLAPTETADRVAAAGRPLVRLPAVSSASLGGELMRWQVATAVSGAFLGLNPFVQPDVEAAKRITRDLMATIERDGRMQVEEPVLAGGDVLLMPPAPAGEDLDSVLARHFDRLVAGRSYFALLAYLDGAAEPHLRRLCATVRDRRGVATSVGLGPRYLHSTGQLFKGGSDEGVFLVLSADSERDVDVPRHPYSFGQVAQAQALGDVGALVERRRPVVHLHLRGDRARALAHLGERFDAVL